MPSLTNRLKLALPNGNEYVNRAALNKIFEDIDRLVMLQGDFDTAKKEIDDILAKKVSKSGDTMTGNLKLPRVETNDQTPVIFNGNTSNRSWKWDLAGDNLSITPTNNGTPGWDASKTVVLQNLLKKTGDTMTDKLWFSGASKGIAWQENSKEVADLIYNGRNIFLRGKPVDGTVYNAVTYDIDKNYFNVQSETNLVKKSGDTMTGDLTMQANMKLQGDTERNLAFRTLSDNREFAKMYANPDKNRVGLYSTKNIKNVWEYDGSTDSFNVTTNTNLLKKTGDTMTGDLNFDVSAALKRISAYDGSTKVSSLAMTKTGLIFLEDGLRNNFNPWVYDSATQMFTVSANTNLLKKSGDTMSGNLGLDRASGERALTWYKGGNETTKIADNDTRTMLYSTEGNEIVWTYEKASKTFEVRTPTFKFEGRKVLTTSDLKEKIPSRSGKDDNGIYTIYEETQKDGKLSKRSVLSNPDTDGNYLVRTVTYYLDGVGNEIEIFDLKYDEDGDFVKAVPR